MAMLGNRPKPLTATVSDRHDRRWTKIEKYRKRGGARRGAGRVPGPTERKLALHRERLREIGLSEEIFGRSLRHGFSVYRPTVSFTGVRYHGTNTYASKELFSSLPCTDSTGIASLEFST